MSRAFNDRSEAEAFKTEVNGFMEILTDDKLDKIYVVFYKAGR